MGYSRHSRGRKEREKKFWVDIPEEREQEALSDFIEQRWPDGRPKCPNCESEEYYWLRKRGVFKCKDCSRQYSPFTDTPFKFRKMPYSTALAITKLKPCSVTDLMNHTGLTYKAAWMLRGRLANSYPEWGVKVRHQPERPLLLAYPYIVKPREEHADIMEVAALVPRGLPADARADICQEVILALLEGRTTLDELRDNRNNLSFFVRRFYNLNHEQSGHAKSLDERNDDRTYYDTISAISAKEWVHNEMNEIQLARDSLSHHQNPTQIGEIFESQIVDFMAARHLQGHHITHGEARYLVNQDDYTSEEVKSFKDEIKFERQRSSGSNDYGYAGRKEIRAHLWRQQKGRCCYCKRLTRLPESGEHEWMPLATLEHIRPLSDGGKMLDSSNLAMACGPCNSKRGGHWWTALGDAA